LLRLHNNLGSATGWHPGEPPFYAAHTQNIIKKREKIFTRGGTRPRPSKQEKAKE